MFRRLLTLLTIPTIALLARCVPNAPPEYGVVPPFALLDAEGAPHGSAELAGAPYVASFFFTRCASICPVLMSSVKALQDESAAEGLTRLRLVSVSVDPGYDTPERLREYGARLGRDPARWVLLTGGEDAIRSLAVEGFKVPLGERTELAPGLLDVAHTGKLVLVDARGAIRGYFDSNEVGRAELLRAARSL